MEVERDESGAMLMPLVGKMLDPRIGTMLVPREGTMGVGPLAVALAVLDDGDCCDMDGSSARVVSPP